MTGSVMSPSKAAARGVVASPHHLASEAGIAALRAGGNALDAAVAAAAAIAVVYPHMNSVGGDSVWLVFDAQRRTVFGLNAAGRSAARATLEAYRARHGATMPTRGGEAALTVPGVVSGWWEIHRYSRERLGSPLAWSPLLGDAIRHARDGFPPSPGQHRVTAAAAALFAADAPRAVRATFWPVYHPDRLARERFVQHDLALTLERVASDGAEEFYRGSLGRRIAAGAESAGSPLRHEDFVEHRADWVDPLSIPYRGGVAVSTPPPTQGVAALAILALLEGFEVAAMDDATLLHTAVEATKLAFEDRDRYLADPTVERVPVEHMLDPTRLADRRRAIGRVAARVPLGASAEGDTVAVATADAAGNAVCVIQSTYHEFGAAVVAGDTGVLLQNRGAFFSLDDRHPNRLAPRKRTAHTLIPSMYLADGRPRFVYGTMGGDGQPQTQAAVLTRLVDRRLSPQAAVDAPRWLWGRTWGDLSRAVRIEARFDAAVADDLRRRGHEVVVVGAWDDLMGHAQVIELAADGLRAGSDRRADGAALGV